MTREAGCHDLSEICALQTWQQQQQQQQPEPPHINKERQSRQWENEMKLRLFTTRETRSSKMKSVSANKRLATKEEGNREIDSRKIDVILRACDAIPWSPPAFQVRRADAAAAASCFSFVFFILLDLIRSADIRLRAECQYPSGSGDEVDGWIVDTGGRPCADIYGIPSMFSSRGTRGFPEKKPFIATIVKTASKQF